MKKEKKEVQNFLSGKQFLLGRRLEDNKKIYLSAGSWDCNWYWGFGYLQSFNKLKTDINEHYHFDSLLKEFGLTGIEKHFKSFVLEDKEIWILADLMSSFYKLEEVVEIYYQGGSHYTDTSKILSLKDLKMYERINKDIEKVIKKAEELLTPED